MSADSEIAQMWNAVKERKRENKEARSRLANTEGWEYHRGGFYWKEIGGKKLKWWTSTGTCMYDNKRFGVIWGKRARNLLEKHGQSFVPYAREDNQ